MKFKLGDKVWHPKEGNCVFGSWLNGSEKGSHGWVLCMVDTIYKRMKLGVTLKMMRPNVLQKGWKA